MVSDTHACVNKTLPDTVLILVLMEYGLWPRKEAPWGLSSTVLILVLMEYGLWPEPKDAKGMRELAVLILVLMEYGLWLNINEFNHVVVTGLNPCSNGIWSLTRRSYN